MPVLSKPARPVQNKHQPASQVPAKNLQALPRAAVCVAIWSLLIFLAGNTVLSLLTSIGMRRHAHSEAATVQACDSAVNEFQHSKQPPGLVLMGSSVVMAPVWSVDARHFPAVPDVYHHHQSRQLANLLGKHGITQVFTFALPGLMISDGYLIADKLLKGAHKPKLLIYGLTPRDFMDDLLTGETRTATFQRLMKLEDLPGLGRLYLSSLQEKIDFALNNLVFLYGKRWRYQGKFNQMAGKTLAWLSPAAPVQAKSQAEQQFLLEKNRQLAWARSKDEYRIRYRHFDAAQFSKQKGFLAMLLALARQRNLPVVLVNMPLTKDNLALMPAGFYTHYLVGISNLAKENGVPLLDMQMKANYTDACFYDTVHLNQTGGEKFLQDLANWILVDRHDNQPGSVGSMVSTQRQKPALGGI